MPEPPNPAAEPPLTAERVFREYAPRVYNLARRMLGNDADAEDVTQDVLLQVVRKLDTFRGESAFPTWLHRVTVNAALAHRRKRANRQARQTSEPLDSFLEDGHAANGPMRPWSVSPDQPLLNAETQHLIERAIAGLPETYRDVYVLADVRPHLRFRQRRQPVRGADLVHAGGDGGVAVGQRAVEVEQHGAQPTGVCGNRHLGKLRMDRRWRQGAHCRHHAPRDVSSRRA